MLILFANNKIWISDLWKALNLVKVIDCGLKLHLTIILLNWRVFRIKVSDGHCCELRQSGRFS